MSPRIESLRRARRWLLPAALLALVPKCALCVAGYFGLAVVCGLPLAPPEFCGGAGASSVPWPTWLAGAGLLAGAAGGLRRDAFRRLRALAHRREGKA